jgi:hypothetical protein
MAAETQGNSELGQDGVHFPKVVFSKVVTGQFKAQEKPKFQGIYTYISVFCVFATST